MTRAARRSAYRSHKKRRAQLLCRFLFHSFHFYRGVRLNQKPISVRREDPSSIVLRLNIPALFPTAGDLPGDGHPAYPPSYGGMFIWSSSARRLTSWCRSGRAHRRGHPLDGGGGLYRLRRNGASRGLAAPGVDARPMRPGTVPSTQPGDQPLSSACSAFRHGGPPAAP